MKTIALDLLDCADTTMGKQKTFNYVQHEPTLIPRSAKFKFDLTYSKELLFYQRYIVLVEYYASSVQTMHNFLCNQMCALLKLEVEVSRQKKNGETLLSPILTFDQELVILYRICNKHINLQTNDREIAVIYLHTYLCTNSINITTYINTSKERQLHQLNTICRYNIPHQNDTTATTLIKNRRNEGSVKATQRNLLE